MRIAMVGPFGFHPNKTMRSRAFGLARSLAERAHQVCLIMPPWHTPEESDSRWMEDGVEIRYTSLKGGLPGTSWRLVRETLAWRPDVVHCFKPKAYSGLVMWWLWHFHRKRLRLILDSDDWEGRGGWNDQAPYTTMQKRFFAWQEKWGYRHNHAVTVASRTLQSLAWSQGVPHHQVVYLPNGPGIGANEVPEQDQCFDEHKKLRTKLDGRPVMLWYSRLFESDADRLVTVLAGVKEAVPEMAVLVVGAGLYPSDAERFRQSVQEAGLEDSIIDAGWIEQALLPKILTLADVALYLMDDTLLNRAKCPVKLADMLSLGIPVVAEAVGQVSEYVIHGETGRLQPSGKEVALVEDLVELLRNPAERERLSTGAKKHISTHFNWGHLSQIVEQAYLGVTG